uniref:Uncharacterized protein n=1 Tax=Timema bartmani TaxID=61472 RepID=A0A7R9EVV7_9NEOP|nr:unnamed protein product [Timema bartmani]
MKTRRQVRQDKQTEDRQGNEISDDSDTTEGDDSTSETESEDILRNWNQDLNETKHRSYRLAEWNGTRNTRSSGAQLILSLALFVNMATKRKAVIQDTEILAIFIDSSTQNDQFVCDSESSDSEFVADCRFEFCVKGDSDSGLSGTWQEDDVEMTPYRRVLLFQADKLDSVIDRIKTFVAQKSIVIAQSPDPGFILSELIRKECETRIAYYYTSVLAYVVLTDSSQLTSDSQHLGHICWGGIRPVLGASLQCPNDGQHFLDSGRRFFFLLVLSLKCNELVVVLLTDFASIDDAVHIMDIGEVVISAIAQAKSSTTEDDNKDAALEDLDYWELIFSIFYLNNLYSSITKLNLASVQLQEPYIARFLLPVKPFECSVQGLKSSFLFFSASSKHVFHLLLTCSLSAIELAGVALGRGMCDELGVSPLNDAASARVRPQLLFMLDITKCGNSGNLMKFSDFSLIKQIPRQFPVLQVAEHPDEEVNTLKRLDYNCRQGTNLPFLYHRQEHCAVLLVLAKAFFTSALHLCQKNSERYYVNPLDVIRGTPQGGILPGPPDEEHPTGRKPPVPSELGQSPRGQ